MNKKIRQPGLHLHWNNQCSFILHLWWIEQPNASDWRASVEITETGQRIGFASLERLFTFLVDYTETSRGMHPFENEGKEYSK